MVAGLSDQARGALAKFRATLNLWINVVLVYLLGRTWPLVWLLFVLSSSATAIYGTRERTLINAFFLSAVLGVVNYLHGFNTPLDWAVVGGKAAFLVLTSLLINDLAQSKKETP
jgi:hypothetical protein